MVDEVEGPSDPVDADETSAGHSGHRWWFARTEPGRTADHRDRPIWGPAGGRAGRHGGRGCASGIRGNTACTDSAYRARSRGLVQALVASIQADGDVPILHALTSNVGAIRLYESLGFVTPPCARRTLILEAATEVR